MTDLQVFKPMFPANGYNLRALLIEAEPWFVAADVCGILDVINPSHAVRRLDSDEYQQVALSLVSNDPSDRNRKATLVSEPGLYGLVLGSRKDEAALFKRWIKHEVLPSIRKTGGYGAPALPTSPRELAMMVIAEADRADRAEGELKVVRPAVEAHAAYLDSTGTMSMATTAQMLKTGQNRLFRELREREVLIGTAGPRLNTPYQRYVALGWFEVKAGTRERSNGETEATYTTRVTPKGLEGIRRLLAG